MHQVPLIKSLPLNGQKDGKSMLDGIQNNGHDATNIEEVQSLLKSTQGDGKQTPFLKELVNNINGQKQKSEKNLLAKLDPNQKSDISNETGTNKKVDSFSTGDNKNRSIFKFLNHGPKTPSHSNDSFNTKLVKDQNKNQKVDVLTKAPKNIRSIFNNSRQLNKNDNNVIHIGKMGTKRNDQKNDLAEIELNKNFQMKNSEKSEKQLAHILRPSSKMKDVTGNNNQSKEKVHFLGKNNHLPFKKINQNTPSQKVFSQIGKKDIETAVNKNLALSETSSHITKVNTPSKENTTSVIPKNTQAFSLENDSHKSDIKNIFSNEKTQMPASTKRLFSETENVYNNSGKILKNKVQMLGGNNSHHPRHFAFQDSKLPIIKNGRNKNIVETMNERSLFTGLQENKVENSFDEKDLVTEKNEFKFVPQNYTKNENSEMVVKNQKFSINEVNNTKTQDLIKKISDYIVSNIDKNGNDVVELTVDADEMGKLTIEVKKNEDKVDIKINSDLIDTNRLLKSNKNHLINKLTQSGVEVEKFIFETKKDVFNFVSFNNHNLENKSDNMSLNFDSLSEHSYEEKDESSQNSEKRHKKWKKFQFYKETA